MQKPENEDRKQELYKLNTQLEKLIQWKEEDRIFRFGEKRALKDEKNGIFSGFLYENVGELMSNLIYMTSFQREVRYEEMQINGKTILFPSEVKKLIEHVEGFLKRNCFA